jgi:hypothetical protein
MKLLIIILVSLIGLYSCTKGPYHVENYNSKVFPGNRLFTYSIVNESKSGEIINLEIENVFKSKGMMRVNSNYDCAVFVKTFRDLTDFKSVDEFEVGHSKYSRISNQRRKNVLLIQIMETETQKIVYRSLNSNIPSKISDNQLKSIIQSSLKEFNQESSTYVMNK